MRILVCGGRYFSDKKLLYNVLWEMVPKTEADPYGNQLPKGVTIIHGAAPGADRLADDWAIGEWCAVEEYPADWVKFGRSAGPIRNREMLDKGKPDVVVAFPGGKGTENMIQQAISHGVKVIKVADDGKKTVL